MLDETLAIMRFNSVWCSAVADDFEAEIMSASASVEHMLQNTCFSV